MPVGWNRLIFRKLGVQVWGAFGTLSACTAPSFEPVHAGDAASPTADATASITPQCGSWAGDQTLPAGSGELVGLYAARFDGFGFDDIATIRAREHEQRILTAEIVERSGQLQMELHTCDWHSSYGSLGTLLTAHSAPVGLESMPPLVLRMRFGPGCSWSASPVEPQVWGYAAASPSHCTPGLRATRSPEQTWLLGSCNCSLGDQALPVNDVDCRVTDPDGDKNPGITIEWQNEELGREVYYVAMRNESQLVDGSFAGDTLTARELRRLTSAHLGGDFPRMPTRCPDSTSRVALKRLADGVGGAAACDDARRAFWVETQPPFPERECADPSQP